MTVLFVPIHRQFTGILGNHPLTQRFTYTVPANKRAELCFAYSRVIEFGGAVGNANAQALVYRNGVIITDAYSRNILGQITDMTFNSIWPLSAGDIISASTYNVSAVNVLFTVRALIKEYT